MLDENASRGNLNGSPAVCEFNVVCPNCSASFQVPTEFGGEMAECAECGSVFRIPVYRPDAVSTEEEPAVAESLKNTEESRSTVRLSRTSIGMIPALKDEFEIGGKAVPPRDY